MVGAPRTSDPRAQTGSSRSRGRARASDAQSGRNWGGRRAGAGRKKDHDRRLRDHLPRPEVRPSTPAHVTLRVRPHVWNLRSKRAFRVVTGALRAARDAHDDGRFVHFSLQGNHLHLIVEADDRVTLARRVQGLEVRLARALNRMMKRSGPVFADRYHLRILHGAREVRTALAYVLRNAARHHGLRGIDPYSSGPWFDGWAPTPLALDRGPPTARPCRDGPLPTSTAGRTVPDEVSVRPTAEPRSRVLRVGYLSFGSIALP